LITDRSLLIKELRGWQADTAFASVRAPEALARFPAEEQRSWQSLWEEVAALLKAAQADRP
jgi:hypothetical protein